MRFYDSIGVQIPQVLLPRPGLDLTRWAVIACDQFTSEADYWCAVEDFVGDEPSTLHLILPEVYLDGPDLNGLTLSIQANMWRYLQDGLLEAHDGMVYVERSVNGKTRRGLMMALDLDQYDYTPHAKTLIRATEGTIIERIHPRMRIRDGARLELPHILVLIDDPERTVIEPVQENLARLPRLYDFDLMLDSGHLRGHLVSDLNLETGVVQALERLASPEVYDRRYGFSGVLAPPDGETDKFAQQTASSRPIGDKINFLAPGDRPLLFAMGDGNHSFATAKAIWERIRRNADGALSGSLGRNHPARYALVEVENIHDEGLEFEPIHRVLFKVRQDLLAALSQYFGADWSFQPVESADQLTQAVDIAGGRAHTIGLVSAERRGLLVLQNPVSNLPVGSLQSFLDEFMRQGGAEKIDYVHGKHVVFSLGAQPENAGFYLPVIQKHDLFKTVILDGALPRKAFSMGEAHEKRFYMESRRIDAW